MYFSWTFVCLFSLAYANQDIPLSNFVEIFNQNLSHIQWNKMLSEDQTDQSSIKTIKIRTSIQFAKDHFNVVSNNVRSLCNAVDTDGPNFDLDDPSHRQNVNESTTHLLESLKHLEEAHELIQQDGIEVKLFIFTNGTAKLDVEEGYGCKIKRLLSDFPANFQCSIKETTFFLNNIDLNIKNTFKYSAELIESEEMTKSVIDQINDSKSTKIGNELEELIEECKQLNLIEV